MTSMQRQVKMTHTWRGERLTEERERQERDTQRGKRHTERGERHTQRREGEGKERHTESREKHRGEREAGERDTQREERQEKPRATDILGNSLIAPLPDSPTLAILHPTFTSSATVWAPMLLAKLERG